MSAHLEHRQVAGPRQVLFVAGAGRSGTSTFAGLVRILGLCVPPPEVEPDESNPKGFAEPAWAVAHHSRLLRAAGVQVSDARPEAWAETRRVSEDETERRVTADWLGRHLDVRPEVVVKDPRLSWFLPLWREAALRCGSTPVFVTMLRSPSEVVGSKQKYYANTLGSAHLAASWLNMLLHTEEATRDRAAHGGRAFVRYTDLLDDWVATVGHVGETLGWERLRHPAAAQVEEGRRFVDPELRRVSGSLDDLSLPPRLHELTVETWRELDRLAEPGGDRPQVHRVLDQLRGAYVDLYAESAAISRSSVVAVQQRHRRVRAASGPPAPAPATAPATAASSGAVGPRRLRAAVPPGLRRALRRAAGRTR